jgi:hypothetical protein
MVRRDEMDEPVWDATVFTKNRDRLLNQEILRSFFRRVVGHLLIENRYGLIADAMARLALAYFSVKNGRTNSL